jgi:hypothetical protein
MHGKLLLVFWIQAAEYVCKQEADKVAGVAPFNEKEMG